MKPNKVWMAVVTDEDEVVFSCGCQSKRKAEREIVKYLCENQNFGVSNINEACFAIGEDNLPLNLMIFDMALEDFKDIQIHRGLLVQPPPDEKDACRVVYTIDVNAGDALKAAKVTHQIMADPESWKPVFEVIDHKGKVTKIDLSKNSIA